MPHVSESGTRNAKGESEAGRERYDVSAKYYPGEIEAQDRAGTRLRSSAWGRACTPPSHRRRAGSWSRTYVRRGCVRQTIRAGLVRRVIVSEFVSLDGVFEAPDKWHLPYFDDEMGQEIGRAMAASDATLDWSS